ncbi:MAG TPA: PaaI family thioesterase [Pyrinomonadaceae bacterium]|nr:PaaI family thioesterase [Pyrinomonadaceae bacterium]
MSQTELSQAQRDRIAKAMDMVPFARLLGLQLESAVAGQAVMTLQIRDELLQNLGVVHGGVTASLIDSAAALAIVPLLEAGERATTVDLTINYLRPLRSGKVTATARVLRAGKRIIAVSADVEDEAGNLAATGLTTYLRFLEK